MALISLFGSKVKSSICSILYLQKLYFYFGGERYSTDSFSTQKLQEDKDDGGKSEHSSDEEEGAKHDRKRATKTKASLKRSIRNSARKVRD